MHRTAPPATIIVHGGAGDLGPDDPASSGGPAAPRLEGVRRACAAGWEILRRGGSALDAVEAAVRLLEDDPTFNAGTGATLTSTGEVELDASIMEGASLRCGAVAAVRDVRNPVALARAVMERGEHVLLAGDGASAFAREAGIPAYANALLVTARQRARWEAARRSGPARPGHGTVGAAARDAAGHLAAATSTGGTSLKRPGRVGDTPLVGCGTYADDTLAAVSCTGHGERIIQLTLARHAADLVGAGRPPAEAAREAVALLARRVQGAGGLVVVGPAGEPGFAHNTQVMSRAWVREDGAIEVGL
ncbi:MAG TPA: isoaspartyl peptidase/L-asparaginase [Anaeromyxobacter sp.]